MRSSKSKSSNSKSKKSTKNSDKYTLKVMIVKKINENKQLLFGALSNSVTDEAKRAKWNEILDYATSIGFQINGDWEYLRNTIWASNWKRRAIEKWDQKRKTGAGGGDEVQLTELDEAVMDVVGRESASAIGIRGATESMEVVPEDSVDPELIQSSVVSQNADMINDDELLTRAPPASTKSIKKRKVPEPAQDMAMPGSKLDHLKNEKADLQVKHLKLANFKLELETYKTQLEIMQLENTLGYNHKYPVDTPRNGIETFNYGGQGDQGQGSSFWGYGH